MQKRALNSLCHGEEAKEEVKEVVEEAKEALEEAKE